MAAEPPSPATGAFELAMRDEVCIASGHRVSAARAHVSSQSQPDARSLHALASHAQQPPPSHAQPPFAASPTSLRGADVSASFPAFAFALQPQPHPHPFAASPTQPQPQQEQQQQQPQQQLALTAATQPRARPPRRAAAAASHLSRASRRAPPAPTAQAASRGGGGGGAMAGEEDDEEEEDEDDAAEAAMDPDVADAMRAIAGGGSSRLQDEEDEEAEEKAAAAAGVPPEERQRRRLARKAELARESRRRKKMYVQDLENKVRKLGAKIEELQRQAARAKASRRVRNIVTEEKELRDAQIAIRERMAAITRSGAQDEAAREQLSALIRSFTANSRARQARVDHHLDQVEDCLTPGLQVRFVLWALDQSDEFYSAPNNLWSRVMVQEVGVTPEQVRLILSRRRIIHEERQRLLACERALKDLRERIAEHLKSLNQNMDALQAMLTPHQQAKFFVWVEQNEWCMQMLNSMWHSYATPPPPQQQQHQQQQHQQQQHQQQQHQQHSSSSLPNPPHLPPPPQQQR
jgi:Mg2+ and Co2+ transporter CorA